MAVFEYQALNTRGKKVKGLVDAESVRAARLRLKQQGIFPINLAESSDKQSITKSTTKSAFRDRRISTQQIAVATRQFATLVGAGIPLVEGLKALSDQLDHPRLKRVFGEVSDGVNEGSTLADAMRLHPKVFPRIYVNMVSSGEVSGSLDIVLERLSELLEATADLRRKVIAASAYPVLMLILCVGVIMILLGYVVPEITAIFQEKNATLPLPTRIVIGLSNFIQLYWWVIFAVFGLIGIAFRRYTLTKVGRHRFDSFKLRAPIIGPITLKVATARFSRTLGTMLTSGIELLSALSIVKNILDNVVLEEAIDSAINGVREGKSLSPELSRAQVFPKLLMHMIAIGEKTGQLEPMLIRAATSYESEVDALISGLTKILEPVLILFLACIVGGILFSVMLPMLEMSSLAT